MSRDGGRVQAFNGQIVVDDAHQIAVAAALSNQAPDAEYFEPLLRRAIDNCNAVPAVITADAGYFSVENVAAAVHLGSEPFIAVGSHASNGLPVDPASPRRTTARDAMNTQISTPRGRALYARRKSTVEPVFGQIRACRGFHHVSLRGLLKARCEWLLVCATHNLLKLWRASAQGLPLALPA